MCSELTPRPRIPDTRIPQLMQPCYTSATPVLWLWINAGHSTLSGDLPSFICLCDIFPTPLNCLPHHHHHCHRNRHHYHLHHITTTITIFATIIIIQSWDPIPLKKGPNQFLFIFGDLASQASLFGICSMRSTYGIT